MNKSASKSKSPAVAHKDAAGLLRELASAEATRRLATQVVDDLVAVLRSPDMDGYCDASWAEVGAALGVSKQAAMQRYNRKGL